MPNKPIPKHLIQETKSLIRVCFFLRHDCGLKYANMTSAKDQKTVLDALKQAKRA